MHLGQIHHSTHRHCGMRHAPLFADLEEDDFRLIDQPIDGFSGAAGSYLYYAGQPGRHLYAICDGLVKLEHVRPDGSTRIVRLLTGGDIVGMEVLTQDRYEQDAIVLEPVLACRIPARVVQRLSQNTPRLHRQLMRSWQTTVSGADQWLADLLTGSSKLRVVKLLMHLAELRNTQNIFLPTREDIGSILSLTTATASRIVAELRREGVLETQSSHIARLDGGRLQQLRQTLSAE